MTVSELQWLIGTSIGVVFSIGGIALMAFRSMASRLDRAVEKVETAHREGDDRLHERVNRLRQEVSDKYVRRIDLDGHLAGIRDQLKELRDDQKEVIKQLTRMHRNPSVQK